MATIMAVFDDGTKAEKAVSELEKAGHVAHVVSSDGSTPDNVAPVAGGTAQAGAAVTGTQPVMGYLALTELSLGSEEEDFYRRSLDDGNELMSVETDEPEKVMSLLEKAGASRVDTVD